MTDLLKVRNPRSGAIDFEITVTDRDEIARIATELRTNQAEWRDQGLLKRIDVLQRWKKVLLEDSAEIVSALSADTGRNTMAQQEVDGVGRAIDRWCDIAPGLLHNEEVAAKAMPAVAMRQQYDPYPLLGAISPWNFPLLLSFIDALPALLAGCAVIIKPSEVTPRFAIPVESSIAKIPELQRVLRFVSGDGRTGAALVECVDVVAFTGSVATGRKVASAAAEAFIPAFLELGGKDPAIILPGSDLERAATSILRASVAATGQACQSLERVYVHESQHDEFLSLLTSKAAAVDLSYPDPNRGTIGPLIFERQAEVIAKHLADAVAKGAIVHTGGEVIDHAGSKWIAPTVLSNVDHSMLVMSEETFGPVMPVMQYRNKDEAVALANDSQYGLSGAVFGATEDEALGVAAKLNAGGISINDAGMTSMVFEACKTAYNFSGMGPSRVGPPGLTRFLRQKAFFINRGDVMPIELLREVDD